MDVNDIFRFWRKKYKNVVKIGGYYDDIYFVEYLTGKDKEKVNTNNT